MRIVVARRIGRTGEGLGNEILPWAKGYVASEVLGAKLVGPSWGLNRRKYYRNFRTNRLDFLVEDLLQALPHHAFTQKDYYESGEIEFDKAVAKWASQKGLDRKKSFIVTVDGMYGGYPSIRNARPFLLSKLLNSREALRNVYQIASGLDREKLFVAVHMRGTQGGHLVPKVGEDVRGRFNIVVPGEWYMSVCASLREKFGNKLQFYFFTDRGGPEYDRAVSEFNPGQTRQPGLTECSDLLLLAQADLRLCSVSSYSLVASYLSGGPYVWYEPQLMYEDGLYTIWGHEKEQRLPTSATSRSIEFIKQVQPGTELDSEFRGYTMQAGDELPSGLTRQLQRKLAAINRSSSLLEYGCLPEWTRVMPRA